MNKKNIKNRLKNIKNIFLSSFTISIIAFTLSCENKSSSLGEELLPDSDKIEDIYDTTLTFSGKIFESEPINTSNLTYYSLGIINDDNFGMFKGEYVTQFLPYLYDNTIVNFTIDSACLFLDIDSVYGDAYDNISFNIYELSKSVSDEGDYLSNTDISTFYDQSDIISLGNTYSGDTLIKFKLPFNFYSELTSVDTSVYADADAFTSAFKGMVIVPEASSPLGGVFFTNPTSNDSKIILYYNDSLTYTYSFPSGGTSSIGHGFAKYSYDYSSSVVNTYLTNPESENDDMLFLQGVNGVSTKITFTNVSSWLQTDSSYSILNAELLIPVTKDDNFELFYPPKRLYIEYDKNDSTEAYIQDYADYVQSSQNIFDGYYDSDNGYYRFFISKHLMRVLNGDVENLSLYLRIINKSFFPHRVILQSSDNIKLKVTYTKH